jgi:hypothetical protein
MQIQEPTRSLFFYSDVGKDSRSADDDIYRTLARSYFSRISHSGRHCNINLNDADSVIRGADWYEIVGGMQDYGYLNYGTIELTMEISCCKYPFANTLASYWHFNRPAMIELLLQAQRGKSSVSIT